MTSIQNAFWDWRNFFSNISLYAWFSGSFPLDRVKYIKLPDGNSMHEKEIQLNRCTYTNDCSMLSNQTIALSCMFRCAVKTQPMYFHCIFQESITLEIRGTFPIDIYKKFENIRLAIKQRKFYISFTNSSKNEKIFQDQISILSKSWLCFIFHPIIYVEDN